MALAFMRLHALGDPLGFFRKGTESMDLPAVYLVDQDRGDGTDAGRTAWQEFRRVLDGHPAHDDVDPRALTPLPVGADQNFLADGMTNLMRHYSDSDYLDCILSPEQRIIEFSRGMMGSPAVGSLLFKLKSYDTRSDDPDVNHDAVYHQLLNLKGRIAVVGSGVGGTGAAVGPTLAEELSGVDERKVMAVMLLNWFEFDELHEQIGENLYRAQRRNRMMRENAHSGLRYYGKRLAEHVAIVPVGIPDAAMAQRVFSGDNHQSKLEAYPHAVAAICCLRQFLDADTYSNGLYHLDAEDPFRLSSGIGLPGGGTIGDLAAGGKTLVATLEIYQKVLGGSSDTAVVKPIFCELLEGRRQEAAEELDKLRSHYSDNLKWLVDKMLKGESPKLVQGSFASEAAIRERMRNYRLESSRLVPPGRVASEIFGWLAEWVREKIPISTPAVAQDVYWPEMFDDQGLALSPRKSGELQKVSKSNVQTTLDSFVDRSLIAQNGWPHPLAAVDYFREAVSEKPKDQPIAIRQLELLLLGLFVGELELRRNERQDKRLMSLDGLVDDHRRNGGGVHLVGQALKRTGQAGVVMGFTAPGTLFCPVPDLPDSEWSRLWDSLTGKKDTDWKAPKSSWGRASSSVRRIRAWVEACKRRRPHETPPPWTRIFDGIQPRPGYGGGAEVEVRWGGNELVKFFLPTRDEKDLPSDAKNLERADLEKFLHKCGEVTTGGGRKFRRFKFEIADNGKKHGIWDDHLRHLQKVGDIEFFGEDAERSEVYAVIWLETREYRLVTLPDTLVLRRGDIGIRSCVPMEQRNIPNGDTPGGLLYPDYPLRWRYFDLVMPQGAQSESEESVLDILRRGDVSAKPKQPEVSESGQEATWSLRMRGRSDSVDFAVKLEISDPKHSAHWMVWPRFHARNWKAYYVYHHCTNPNIGINALWLNYKESRVALFRTEVKYGRSNPIRFSQPDARHKAGPPVALCASMANDEIGLYLVRLDRIGSAAAPVQIGIDFGTSHTTAALKLGDQEMPVDLSPELLSKEGKHKLVLHVSENMDHIENEDEDGPLIRGTWLPRYVKKQVGDLKGLWPSEILTIKEVKTLKNEMPNIQNWKPGLDYVIPPVGLLRRDLPGHKIGNFKWNTSTDFHGKESELRKIYLDRIVEQVLAEVFVRCGRPTDAVRFTFTYPLRTPSKDVKEYRQMLNAVLDDGSESLGCTLALHDGVGLFDESRAAKVGTGLSGDVSMVGDLGGGTLDLIISAVGEQFEDTADSVKLGGNVLLRLIADGEKMLPAGWGDDDKARFANLTAWVRTKGLTGLFGADEERVKDCSELGVRGFDDSISPKKGQILIHRCYFLIVEFMARNLTAYLATHWLPKATDRKRLRIRVYLRGNGWKLWHENYNEIGRSVQKRVMEATQRLWPTLEVDFAFPGNSKWEIDHHEVGQTDRAKRDVVKEIVGRSRDPESVQNKWFSHTLVQLEKVEEDGRRETTKWYDRIPFRTGGKGTNVELSEIHPEIPLSSLCAGKPEMVVKLPVNLTRRINRNLRDKGELVGDAQLDYQAPIAAWVWEAVLQGMVTDPVAGE